MSKLTDLISSRKSVRTFDKNRLSEDDYRKITEYMKQIDNPFNIPVEFVILDAKEHGLSSPVLSGEQMYVAG
ncbi:MAG: nitroreductase, partial [Lachnospiraceae bacterium]|nr:nitroreductase [Lachnospiraceae bacterium]